ncbi:MAG: YbjN domain-containing protein [Lachnospiraceae bacterium]|nr:YbjN domain-containing protein [Lachnospiraceae bacterium]
MKAREILETICDWMDRNSWNYEGEMAEDGSGGILESGVGIESKLQRCDVRILAEDGYYRVMVYVPLAAREDDKARIMKFITLVNYDMKYGDFEMNWDKGQILFKHSICLEGDAAVLTDEMIADSIFRSVAMLETHGDALAALLMGFSTPEEEYDILNGKPRSEKFVVTLKDGGKTGGAVEGSIEAAVKETPKRTRRKKAAGDTPGTRAKDAAKDKAKPASKSPAKGRVKGTGRDTAKDAEEGGRKGRGRATEKAEKTPRRRSRKTEDSAGS